MLLQKYSANLLLIRTLPSRVAFGWVATPEHRAPFLIETHERFGDKHFFRNFEGKGGRF